jgi:hypothetical protein
MRNFLAVGRQQVAILCLLLLLGTAVPAQQNSSDTTVKHAGKVWGYAFGDYYYKAAADSLSRGHANQYNGIEEGRNAFQIRRAYLGFNYDLNQKFVTELLLAAEENFTTTSGTTTGDLLSSNKLAFYIKLLNIRWKNIWKGTDLIAGQQRTPGFTLIEEPVWSYRFIEKTITDIRLTPSFDLGIGLQGKFDPEKGNYGYNVLVGNGTGARPENNKFKWFYGDVFAKFLDQKLIVTLYADYQRMTWTSQYHHSRNMIKAFVAYTVPKFTAGVEAFENNGKNDVLGITSSKPDTLDAHALGISLFLRGILVKEKLSFFARLDNFNPNTKYDNVKYSTYVGLTPAYEPNNKEQFITAGLDFTPMKNVHFSPNIWYNSYKAQQAGLTGKANKDHDLVYRITFFFIYGL